jgi:short-subunit dehydrogenase involved in D-alanine esterification of teichoic acids
VLALVKTIRDRYAVLDVLVNNAGIMERVDLSWSSLSARHASLMRSP